MKKLSLQLFALTLIFALGGCGLNKMVDKAELIQYDVVPSPLEMHAGKVPLEMNVTFPEKYFHKKAYLVVTPYLASNKNDSEIEFVSKTLQGESVKDNNPVINYKTGGSYKYVDTVDYEDIYRMSSLELRISAKKGGDGESLAFASVKVASGIITTPLLVDEGLKVDNGTLGDSDKGLMNLITPTVELPASSTASKKLVLYYPLQKDNLATKEQKKEDVTTFLKNVSELTGNTNVKFKDITIASYASPDGPQDLNHNLVEGRANNSSKFLTTKLNKAKVENTQDFLKRTTTPDEDWDGFKKAVEESNLEDKSVILRVLSMYSDTEVREREIKNMAKVYDELRNDILPQLRRSEIIATYETRQKTSSELVTIGSSNSQDLSQIELFYGAQVAEGPQKETIYKNYTTQYTDDWKAFNNLGVYYIKNNQLDEAELQLQKAEAIDANNATITNNLGVLYWAKEDYEKAAEYFKKAAELDPSDEINYNLGVICIKKGKYEDAVTKFGTKTSYNKSLAQLLAKDTDAAVITLNSVESEEASYDYLKAIENARKGNDNDVFTNLKSAIQKDANYKDYALNDMEFRAYFENETFKLLVQ